MNIPTLKSARGYHKRGKEYKVLYFCSFLLQCNADSSVAQKCQLFQACRQFSTGEKKKYILI